MTSQSRIHDNPEEMKGQVFTVAKIHYVNGVVYFTAERGPTDLPTLAAHQDRTTKSGNAEHPLERVRTLTRFADGLGLVEFTKPDRVRITGLGQQYYEARAHDPWSLSPLQKTILGEHILSDFYRTETVYAITTLFTLFKSGYSGTELSRQFALDIGKEQAWKSDVTYQDFTRFGLDYIVELGLSEVDDRDLAVQLSAKAARHQQTVNDVQPIDIPEGRLPRPRPQRIGKTERYVSNPRRSKNALIAASYRCEIDERHITFTHARSGKPYMEAHHLIPMQRQGQFEFDIDVPENILCLCPNCHRKIHLSEYEEKRQILTLAYDKKRLQLPMRGLSATLGDLEAMYGL